MVLAIVMLPLHQLIGKRILYNMCHLTVTGSMFLVLSVASLNLLVDCLYIAGGRIAHDFGAGLVSYQGRCTMGLEAFLARYDI